MARNINYHCPTHVCIIWYHITEMKFLVGFFPLILSGFSQNLTCESPSGVQTLEYICSGIGTNFQWIVEPVIPAAPGDQDNVRFSQSQNPGGTRTVGNIVATLDSVNPFISRLRIASDAALNETNVTCIIDGSISTLPYMRNVPENVFNLVTCTRTGDCATLNWIPSTSEITYDNKTVLLDSSQNEVTICNISANFYVSTRYLCGSSVAYPVDRCVMTTTNGFPIWAIIITVIAISVATAILISIVLILKLERANVRLKEEEGIEYEEKNPRMEVMEPPED